MLNVVVISTSTESLVKINNIGMHLIKSKEKKERALQTKLFLKAHRCSSPKCAMIRRPSRPGVHGAKMVRGGSEFKMQLMEKQKIKISYGLTETQIKGIFSKALSQSKSVMDSLLKGLEMRLDNVIFRSDLAPSRIMARQLVSHGHFYVNGRKVKSPSYIVKVGDVISLKEKSKSIPMFKDIQNVLKKSGASWISVNPEKVEATVKSFPENVEMPFNANLVVDYYSR